MRMQSGGPKKHSSGRFGQRVPDSFAFPGPLFILYPALILLVFFFPPCFSRAKMASALILGK
jgi:hypothetical protein